MERGTDNASLRRFKGLAWPLALVALFLQFLTIGHLLAVKPTSRQIWCNPSLLYKGNGGNSTHRDDDSKTTTILKEDHDFFNSVNNTIEKSVKSSGYETGAETGDNVYSTVASTLPAAPLDGSEKLLFAQSSVPKSGIETKLITTSTNPHFHMFVYPNTTDRVISQKLAVHGVYEPGTTKLMHELVSSVSPNSDYDSQNLEDTSARSDQPLLALDMGSNLGYYSLLLASWGVHVISFEASPDTAWLQRSSAALNGLLNNNDFGAILHPRLMAHAFQARQEVQTMQQSARSQGSITLLNLGVSNTTSTGRLSRHPTSPGMTSFSKVDQFNLQYGESGEALDVDIDLVRAGDIMKKLGVLPVSDIRTESNNVASNPSHSENDMNLHLLKIDVEGYELLALKGLDLSQYPFKYIVMEYFPEMLRAAGTDPPDLLKYIFEAGYHFFRIGDKGDLKELEIKDNAIVDNLREKGESKSTGVVTVENLRYWTEQKSHKKSGFHINLLAVRRDSLEDISSIIF